MNLPPNSSTRLNKDGEIIEQWIKKGNVPLSQEILNSFLDHVKTIQPFDAPQVQPVETSDILTVYPLADLHLGLYDAIGKLGLNETVNRYLAAFVSLHSRAPHGRVLLANMGDFTHIDDFKNQTPKSGKTLDVSADYSNIVNAAFDLIVRMIANVYTDVDIIWLAGNHDESTGVVMRAALKQIYRHYQGVNVLNVSGRFATYLWGKNLLAFTHGDTVKPEKLPLLLATDYPQQWADSEYRVWHTGHIHHKNISEFIGCTVESHRAPCPRDAWHDTQGYRAQQALVSISYDAMRGEISRQQINL